MVSSGTARRPLHAGGGQGTARPARSRFIGRVAVPALILASLLGGTAAATEAAATAAFAARAERLYQEARRLQAQSPDDPTLGWHFARACFDRAEFATNQTQRAALAEEGIAVARTLVRQNPKLAPARYYLAMNLGQLARTRLLGALPLVSEMESLFHEARQLDPQFDQAGPDRCLGLLYRDAPGWPVSVGSKSKARLHLRRALELSPNSPENCLNLLEALMAWNDETEFAALFATTARILPEARKELAGEPWAASWADWDRRWQILVDKAKRTGTSPRPSTR